jgi:Spy/CpxP family protein refolding chaperone
MKSSRSVQVAFSVLIVLILSASPIVFAQMGMMGGPRKPSGQQGPRSQFHEPFSLESFKDRLGLTDDQAEKFAKLWSDYRKETIKKRADIQVAGIDLTELLDQKKVDMGKIEKKLREIEDLKTELALHRIKTLFKAKEFLSEDQFEKLKGFSLRMMRHGMMMGQMGHGMMGPGMMGGSSEMTPPEEEEGQE